MFRILVCLYMITLCHSQTQILRTVYFVQIAALYFGRMLASTLPQKQIGLGRFSFELNPGPFSIKEHVAIVLACDWPVSRG